MVTNIKRVNRRLKLPRARSFARSKPGAWVNEMGIMQASCLKIRNPVHCESLGRVEKTKEIQLGTVGKGHLQALLHVMALGFTAIFGSQAHAQVFSADAVKAAFLHRFASYVEWPPDALAEGPFVIAVADTGAVAQHLDELLPRITVQGHRAVVRRVARPAELQGVHILYVGAELLPRTRELREAAQRQSILLVTDGDTGFRNGGVINFIDTGTSVRFEISLVSAGRARLIIDSALLGVAVRVEREPQAWSPCTELGPDPDDQEQGCVISRTIMSIRRV